MQGKINNVIRIPSSLDGKFFRYWLEFLKPFHNLTERELQVATEFLKQRYLLQKDITNEERVDQVLMSEELKKIIRTNCGLSQNHFQVIMGKLRKNKFLIENRVNKKFVPNIKEDNGSFKLLLFFDLT